MNPKILLVLSTGPFAKRGEILKGYLAKIGVEVIELDPGPANSVATVQIVDAVKKDRPTHVVFCYAGYFRAVAAVKDLVGSWDPKPTLAIISGNVPELQHLRDAGFVVLSDIRESYRTDFPNLANESEVLKALGLN